MGTQERWKVINCITSSNEKEIPFKFVWWSLSYFCFPSRNFSIVKLHNEELRKGCVENIIVGVKAIDVRDEFDKGLHYIRVNKQPKNINMRNNHIPPKWWTSTY